MPPRRACDVCYKRKIQCLIVTPGGPCDWCKNQDIACTFDRVIPKDPNKRTTSDLVQDLSHRVEELEEALRSARSPRGDGASPWSHETSSPRPATSISGGVTSPTATIISSEQAASDTSSTLLPPPPPPPTLRTIHTSHTNTSHHKLSRCQLGNNWYFKGVGILSSRGQKWISYGSGQRVILEKFDIFDNPISTRPQAISLLPTQPRLLLPPESACRYLIGVFLRSKISIVFPILDEKLIEGTIARAYHNDKQSEPGSQISAEACLWALFALLGRTEEVQRANLIPTPRECADEAKRLLFVINGAVSLDGLQATLLVWAYQKMKGRCREASVALASACRIVCDLGGHLLLTRLPLPPQHVPIFDESTSFHVRRLFWLCYCCDKDASLRTGNPPVLTHDYCEVSDPGEWGNSSTSCWYNQSQDVFLAKIKENASRQLCSPRAFRYTEAELLSQVRQLDDELEEWRLSIEPPYRPRLSVPANSSLSTLSSLSMRDCTRLINLQLDYLFTMIYIHTTVRKCGDFERNLPDDLHSVVHSSADLSLEASRSIFRFLETVVDFWKEDSVWVVSHYAPIAAMPLFVNILIHPLGNPADDDLQILASISNITRNIPLTESVSNDGDIDQVQETGEFVMELIRLCHSAAWKVKKGQREHDLDIIHT